MLKFFKKVFRPYAKKRFSTDDLLIEAIFSGGIFIANKDNHYILVQWADDLVENIDNFVLNTVIPLV